jgi:hypothetical protein
VQEALRAAGIEYEKVIAAHGHPIPFLRKGSREELREATGDTKLPALKLPDGTIITHSRAILAWISRQTWFPRGRSAVAVGRTTNSAASRRELARCQASGAGNRHLPRLGPGWTAFVIATTSTRTGFGHFAPAGLALVGLLCAAATGPFIRSLPLDFRAATAISRSSWSLRTRTHAFASSRPAASTAWPLTPCRYSHSVGRVLVVEWPRWLTQRCATVWLAGSH